jgi:membrane-associated phospholipid phosphatase
MHLLAVFVGMENIPGASCADPDHAIARWFHQHMSPGFAANLEWLSGAGSGPWIGVITAGLMLLLVWKRCWFPLLTLILTVPGGALLGEGVKLIVQRARPYVDGPLGAWGGYSFPSGHTLAATLLYGFLAVGLSAVMGASRWRHVPALAAVPLVLTVGFSRIALGAHYVTDVVGAVILGLAWVGLCRVGMAGLRARLAGSAGELDPSANPP